MQEKFPTNIRLFFSLNTKPQQNVPINSSQILNDVYHKGYLFLRVYTLFLNCQKERDMPKRESYFFFSRIYLGHT